MTTTAISKHVLRLGVAAFLAVPVGASAQTLAFGALVGANLSPFTTYAESGFTVDLFSGTICNAMIFGNPVPDLVGGPVCNGGSTASTLRIKRTAGGLFRFLNTDLATQSGSSTYTFAGFLASVSQYSTTNSFTLSATFANRAGPNPTTDIDELRISLNTTTASSYNIDNIALSVSTVPEPSSVALMSAGLLGLLAVARRRKA